jgi:hypothetical protein
VNEQAEHLPWRPFPPLFYILEGHTPVPIEDIDHWSWWCFGPGAPSRRRVAEEAVGEVWVSTVFTGAATGIRSPPDLFETMVFGGALDQMQWRYATWEEAEAGHAQVVLLVRHQENSDRGHHNPPQDRSKDDDQT